MTTTITPKIAAELLYHEGIVPMCYKDSVGVWTWGIGVTNASGHIVHPRYYNKPQAVEKCIEVYLWLIKEHYLPPVLRAFHGRELTENELAAALSFQYNTGAITRATWVQNVLAGDEERARLNFMQYRRPPSIIHRRERERDLFFDGKWTSDGTTLLYSSVDAKYRPSNAKRFDVMPILNQMLGGN